MTEQHPPIGAPRDVPPPRPVPSATVADDTGLGGAARAVAEAVAEAVAGLLGGPTGGSGTGAGSGSGTGSGDGWARAAATGLRDVVGAVAAAVTSAFGSPPANQPANPPATGPAAEDGSGRSPGALLGDLLATAAPRLPIRDADRLRAAHPGASDEEIADALIARAARLTAGIGAATGGLSAAHWFAPPSLLALPLELGAETVLVGGVEVVLIGELHELYGQRPPGDARARAAAYLAGWSAQRSVDGAGAAGVGSLLGAAGRRALQRRLTGRLARAVPSAAPFMIGAALAGRGNRRATETLAENVRADLRRPPA